MKRLLHFFPTLFLLLAACGNVFGQAGSLDASFGDGGYVKVSLGGESQFSALLLQPDGKIVTVGSQFATDSKVLRYLPNGTLDNSFGTDGIATLDFEPCAYTYNGAGALLPDGKILVAVGEMENNCATILAKIARLHSDGSLDESFGNQGFVQVPNLESFSNQILVYPNGDFVFFGTTQNSFSTPGSILAAKFNEDGSPDAGFGQNGALTIPTDFEVIFNVKVAFHWYGRILIGASGYSDTGYLTLFRINEFGTMDDSFGAGGKVKITEMLESEIGGISMLPDGSILVGASSSYEFPNHVYVAKRQATGAAFPDFGSNGIAKIPFNETCHAYGLALQDDGKILVGGMSGTGFDEDYYLTRFLANGEVDNGFGVGGVAKHLDQAANHCASSLQIQPDGKLVLAGFTVNGMSSMVRFQLGDALGVEPNPSPVSGYRLSPNPSDGHAELRFALLEGGLTQFSLSDFTGKVIWQSEKWLPGGEHREVLDFPNLPAGTYFVKISNGSGSAVDKMIRN